MATMKWVALLAFLLPLQSLAADNSLRVLSRFEVQHDLFVGGTDGKAPSELFPEDGTAKKKSTGLAAIYSFMKYLSSL